MGIKFSQLSTITSPASDDYLPIVDKSADALRTITVGNLANGISIPLASSSVRGAKNRIHC